MVVPALGTGYAENETMRVIARSTLSRFVEALAGRKDQAAVKSALHAWYSEIQSALWSSPGEVKRAYANASIVGSDRVVFNIKGNSYRLVAAIDYRRQVVFIKWLGPHADYDHIDVRTVEYGDQAYQKRTRARPRTARD
jgi:mRNA interferase HigB